MTLLGWVLKEKHKDINDIISSLNEIQKVFHYQCSYLDGLDAHLTHLESHLQCDLKPICSGRYKFKGPCSFDILRFMRMFLCSSFVISCSLVLLWNFPEHVMFLFVETLSLLYHRTDHVSFVEDWSWYAFQKWFMNDVSWILKVIQNLT